MPIKGITDKRRLPRVGKIHLGIMAETPKGVKYPKAVDYFVFPQEHEKYQELIDNFGEKPKELRILIPLEDEDKFASQYYRCYSKTRGLICKGDGEITMRMVDAQTGALADRDSQKVEMREMPCEGRECPDYKSKKCREIMNLQFLLPEITGLGVWQIDTSSINSIRNINAVSSMLKAVYGRVGMMPLILALEQIEVVNPDDGKKKKVWVLNLKSPDSMIDAARRAMQKPLELIAGWGEDITEIEVEMPVPDEDRPELVTTDWEGPAGEPIKNKLTHKQCQEIADIAWPPEDKPKVKPVKRAEDKSHQTGDFEPKELKNLGQFFTACNQRWGLTKSEVEAKIGKTGMGITDLRAEWENIKKIVEGGE